MKKQSLRVRNLEEKLEEHLSLVTLEFILENLSHPERKRFRKILAKEGAKKAVQYAQEMIPNLEQQLASQWQQALKQLIKKDQWVEK